MDFTVESAFMSIACTSTKDTETDSREIDKNVY